MRTLASFALILFSCALPLDTVSAQAVGVPDPAHSSIEAVIVGSSTGALIGDGYRVVVRDVNGSPLNNVFVSLECAATPIRPYDVQVAPETVQCSTRRILARTGPTGLVVFRPRFGGFVNSPSVPVRANGVLIGNAAARSTDLNADGATAIGDLNIFRINFLFAPGNLETDYDESGATAIGDLDIFRKAFLFDTPGTPCP